MTTATRTLLSVGEAARELRAMEYHVRRALQSATYAVHGGRYVYVDPDDLEKLAADLRAAGCLPDATVEA